MSEHVPGAKVTKPKSSKSTPLTHSSPDVPVKIGETEIESSMGRTRSGIHRSTEVWSDRTFTPGDRPAPGAKPQDTGC